MLVFPANARLLRGVVEWSSSGEARLGKGLDVFCGGLISAVCRMGWMTVSTAGPCIL